MEERERKRRDRRIVRAYQGKRRPTLQQLADREGLSTERIRQILDAHNVPRRRTRRKRTCAVVEPEPCGRTFEVPGYLNDRAARYCPEHRGQGYFRGRLPRRYEERVCAVVEPEVCGRRFTVRAGMPVWQCRYCPDHRGQGYVMGRIPRSRKHAEGVRNGKQS